MNPLERLGFTPDADGAYDFDQISESAIKRAYARKLKTTRPDDDPAGFQQLNEAYRNALALARQIRQHKAKQAQTQPTSSAADEDGNAQKPRHQDEDESETAPDPASAPLFFDLDTSEPPPIGANAPPGAEVSVRLPWTLQPPLASQPAPVFSAPTFLRQLRYVAAQNSDADALLAWLEQHPALYTLRDKTNARAAIQAWLAEDQLEALTPTQCQALATFFDFPLNETFLPSAFLLELRQVATQSSGEYAMLTWLRHHPALYALHNQTHARLAIQDWLTQDKLGTLTSAQCQALATFFDFPLDETFLPSAFLLELRQVAAQNSSAATVLVWLQQHPALCTPSHRTRARATIQTWLTDGDLATLTLAQYRALVAFFDLERWHAASSIRSGKVAVYDDTPFLPIVPSRFVLWQLKRPLSRWWALWIMALPYLPGRIGHLGQRLIPFTHRWTNNTHLDANRRWIWQEWRGVNNAWSKPGRCWRKRAQSSNCAKLRRWCCPSIMA